MKQTSIKSYRKIKDQIPAKECEVLDLIKRYGPLNGRMIDGYITGGHKRISNLSDYGCIGIAYIAKDSTTGRETIFYMWLTDTPKPIAKKPKHDPLKLHNLYDSAYKAGVTRAVTRIMKGTSPDIMSNIINEICEDME